MSLKKWTKSTRSSRNVMLASLVLIGAVALYNWIVSPHWNYLMAAQRYESAVGELVRKNQALSNNLAARKKELAQLQEKLALMRTRVFESTEAKKLLGNVQSMAEESNCIIRSLTFSPASSATGADGPKTNRYVTSQRAILSILGNYGNITTLIDKLQDRSQQVRIDSFSIEPAGSSSGLLKCGITITIYVIHTEEG